MRCSSCEALLDRYIGRTLSPRRTYAVALHLRGCRDCRDLLHETRVLDALLDTMRIEDPLAINFTFAVMAEIRTVTPVRVSRIRPWLHALSFLVAFWLLAGGWFLTIGSHDPSTLIAVRTILATLGTAAGTLLAPIRAISGIAPFALAGGVMILFFDAVLLAGLVYFYRYVRPRLHARLSEG